jgi:uncharacterized caspase-like protein
MKSKFHHFILTMLLLFISSNMSGKVYLVSVGVADYPGYKNDVLLTAKDAATIAGVYAKNGNVSYSLLQDRKATVERTKKAMKKLFSKATNPDDVVVFFFAGHGYENGFCCYDGNISYQEVREAMSASPSRSKMIFVNACMSGGLRSRDSGIDSNRKNDDSNVMLLLSSRTTELSQESPVLRNGIFTTCLERGLRGGADANGDRIITAAELFDYVHSGVVKLTKDQQHPVMWGNFDKNMTVMKW